ncbi:hypothetical protein [Hymenobacter ruricola]|uniref:DUF2306 domain-containing protein n=1 Tax=Hymenobacter ruricola TaxID=2791023 RepID=A0ABS0I7U7_9BACT|nr:hypothetical protein [Hymenobacter ruricola]MBF9223044.1 hypothetical protein [Hymenobacter ruricola]
MGDILLGTLLTALVFFCYVIYQARTRSTPETRSRRRFVLLVLLVGAGLGFVTAALNFRHLHKHPWVYVGSMVFFAAQAGAALATYRHSRHPTHRNTRPAALLLWATLLAQVPIVGLGDYSYHNQTLVSFRLSARPRLAWDVEPGSYVSYHYIRQLFREVPFVPGLNVVPVLLLAGLLARRKGPAEVGVRS